MMEFVVSQIGVLGVTLIAFISGFGSVSCPYEWANYFLHSVDNNELIQTETRLLQAMERLLNIKKRMLLLESRIKMDEMIHSERHMLSCACPFFQLAPFYEPPFCVSPFFGFASRAHKRAKMPLF